MLRPVFRLVVATPRLALFGLALAAAATVQAALPPGLFLSQEGLERVKERVARGEQPYRSAYDTFLSVASSYLSHTPDPFYMDDIRAVEFGWCSSAGAPDDSLKDLVEKLTNQSNKARSLAVAYLLTGDAKFAAKAKEFSLAWVDHSALVNFYDFNIDFKSGSFDGMESGFCNNSWNMALDSMWQTYGLINFSDTFAILSRNGSVMTQSEKERFAGWLRKKLVPATNAGFHAWTRWADAHPNSSSYVRYRSDNHLSWALAGLAAAAAALDDQTLWNYVYLGQSYDDGRSGLYANPSSVRATIGRAIAADGEVYDQKVRAGEHKGLNYAYFHLWALSLTAQIAEVSRGDNYWTFVGSRGGSLATAFDRYARYGAGELPPPDPEETTDPAFFRFLYEMMVGNSWASGERAELYRKARDAKPRNQLIKQSVGPFAVLTGGLAEDSRVPISPTNLKVVE